MINVETLMLHMHKYMAQALCQLHKSKSNWSNFWARMKFGKMPNSLSVWSHEKSSHSCRSSTLTHCRSDDSVEELLNQFNHSVLDISAQTREFSCYFFRTLLNERTLFEKLTILVLCSWHSNQFLNSDLEYPMFVKWMCSAWNNFANPNTNNKMRACNRTVDHFQATNKWRWAAGQSIEVFEFRFQRFNTFGANVHSQTFCITSGDTYSHITIIWFCFTYSIHLYLETTLFISGARLC